MDVHEVENPRPPSNVAESQDGASRHVRSKASWGLSTAVHGVGFVAKKVISNRLTDSLWHSRRSNSSASVPSDTLPTPDTKRSETLPTPDTKRENHSPETIYHHTSKPSLNVADEQTAKLPVSSKPTHEREKTPLRGRNVIDSSEISKPQDETQHRWPSTTGSHVIDESENLKPSDGSHVDTTDSKVIGRVDNTKPTDAAHVKTVDQHRWSTTSGSNVWPSTTGSNVVDQLGNLKPSLSSHVRRVNQHRWPSMTSSNAVDQSETSKPQDGLHARQVNQHRWPGTVGSNVLNKNFNHSEEGVRAPHLRRPSLQNHASKTLPESSSDATNLLSSSVVDDGRLKIDKPTEFQPSSPNKSSGLASRGDTLPRTRVIRVNPSPIVRGVSLTPATRVGSHTPFTRGVSLTPMSKGVSLASATRTIDHPPASEEVGSSLAFKEVDPSLTTRGISPSPAFKGVNLSSATRDIDPMPPARGVSPTPTARSVSPPPDILTPTMSSSPKKLYNLNKVSISTESGPSLDKESGLRPTRGVSPTPSRWIKSLTSRGVSPTPRGVSPTPARGVSPTPTRGVSPMPTRGVSPTPTRGLDPRDRGVSSAPNKSSGTRHFFRSNILSIFTKITDSRKEKNLGSYKESAQYLELLYNIQVQWQFVNASSEAVLDLQRVTAEKSLFDVWRTILEIRDSISAKKIEIDLLILQLKLYAVLYRQMAYIDEWASIQGEYESAVSITTNDLQARSLSLPITGGVKADIKSLKLIVFSTVQVLQTTISCIHSTLSKLEKTHSLASELANVALHERALLDECEIFLASAAPLQIEECSLRSYLIQLDRTCKNE